MKNLIAILCLVTGTLISCSEEKTGNVSRITNYPIITLNGDPVEFVVQGETYTDPGAVAVEGDTEIPVETTNNSGTYYGSAGVDTSTPDLYVITYSAENADGFAGSNLRNVWVMPPAGDLTTTIEGFYTADVQRAPNFTPGPPYEDMQYILITKTGDNTYEMTHAIGGYYDIGRGYGPGYAARGAVITANSIPGNDFTVAQAQFPIWGNTVDITGMEVNASNKQITFTGDGNFGNGTFKVQLTQVQF